MILSPHDIKVPFNMRTTDEIKHYISEAYKFSLWFKETFNLPIYLIYGSSLGACREHQVILHDYDIDIAYLSNETDKQKIYQQAIDIKCVLDNKKLIYRSCEHGHNHIWSLDKNIVLDLWASWIDNTNHFYAVGAYDGRLIKEDIVPFKTALFGEYEFNIPNNFDKFLTDYYGDWKIPHKELKWTSTRTWVRLTNKE